MTGSLYAGSSYDPDCAFCKIVRGQDEAYVVWDDELALAFLPLNPAVVGHTLLVPKAHVVDYWALDNELAGHLARVSLKVGRAIISALQPGGMNLITSAGEAASQTVFHLHIHLVPRRHDDRIGPIWPPDRPTPEGVKEDVSELIRRVLRG